MRVPRIFVDETLALGMTVSLDSHNSHYLRNVLRLDDGQDIVLFNGRDSQEYTARAEQNGKQVVARVHSSSEGANDPAAEIHLFQALGRSDAVDLVVQKATELGATSIRFFNAERTQTPLKLARLDKKITHWRAIAISACAQCQRNQLPEIGFDRSLAECLERVGDSNSLFLEFTGDGIATTVNKFQPDHPVSILVGPEGGFNENEIALIRDSGALACRIGPRVLRMETAALSALALVQHYLGDM
jgi:16S rRNA (uracil1498-N3)-methyltransferase